MDSKDFPKFVQEMVQPDTLVYLSYTWNILFSIKLVSYNSWEKQNVPSHHIKPRDQPAWFKEVTKELLVHFPISQVLKTWPWVNLNQALSPTDISSMHCS